MILNIFGGGGSGKTTLQFTLLELVDASRKLVPFTTRKKRPNEINGVHYHFVTKEVFMRTGLVLKRHVCGLWYGVAYEDLYSDGILVTTFDIKGMLDLQKMGLEVRVVYLNIPEPERTQRMLTRGDDAKLVTQRIMLDRQKIHCPPVVFLTLEVQEDLTECTVQQVVEFMS